jgi:hypothetical protein
MVEDSLRASGGVMVPGEVCTTLNTGPTWVERLTKEARPIQSRRKRKWEENVAGERYELMN